MKDLLTKPILRKILLLVLISIISFIGVISYYCYIIIPYRNESNFKIKNQTAKLELGKIISKKLVMEHLAVTHLLNKPNEQNAKHYNKEINISISEIYKIINILQKGGEYEYEILCNLNEVNTLSKTIYYQKPKDEGIIIFFINLNPRISIIEELSNNIISLILKNSQITDAQKKEKVYQQLLLYEKKLHTIFIRAEEDISKIFIDVENKLDTLKSKQQENLKLHNIILLGIFIFLLTHIIIISTIVIKQVNELLNNKEKYNLKQLEFKQKQLVEASREAGKAEIATDVIHNIGNALNSINISAEITKDKIDDLQLNIINKIVELMEQHQKDLGDFMTNSKKGKLIPILLKEFSAHIAEDKSYLDDEVKKMKLSVEHIRSIIQVQQSNAKNVLVIDLQNPIELFEIAIKMNEVSISRHDISLEKCFSEVPNIKTDKHKVLQILINLISNAKGAFTDLNQNDKKIICKIIIKDEFLEFSVIDNGVGILKENIDKIFNYGFTTKKTGHGFGLHNSANTAEQLNGDLTVVSEGYNKGTSFKLKIPYQLNESDKNQTNSIN